MNRLRIVYGLLLAALLTACGGSKESTTKSAAANDPICNCLQTAPDSDDYRHDAKRVAIPSGNPQEITVDTILGWPVPAEPAANAPRTGRENQLFHIAHAYLQHAWQNNGDCDLHLEVSAVPDKTAPRVIVETPQESNFCPSRFALKQSLLPMGVTLGPGSGELNPPVPVQVTGLAFQDFNHKRGTDWVKTPWELHPAVVSTLPK